jgi:hypothetical protein
MLTDLHPSSLQQDQTKMAGFYPGSRRAIERTVDDEHGDLESCVRNAVAGAYVDWPNEAGASANLLHIEHRGRHVHLGWDCLPKLHNDPLLTS